MSEVTQTEILAERKKPEAATPLVRAPPVKVRPTSTPLPAAPPRDPPTAPLTGVTGIDPMGLFAYQRDVLERTILFMDIMRKRANNMLEHERNGMPPLLNFKHEMLLDARTFDRPTNYALLRIIEVGEDCWDDCVDPTKPPVIIVDPRAGHGAGMGGFKRVSEVGMALHTGHPVYFVVFLPEPCQGQTLDDVIKSLGRFVAHVGTLHKGHKPVLYGNCQGGWASVLIAADCETEVGAVVLNGSPLSYWEGEAGANPMRLAGGLLGGVWMTHFLADLNLDRLDGAWLVQNFESLNPGNAHFEKYANLFTRIDTEADRFLDFERWWGGFNKFSGEEIIATVEDLFIGNKIEQGKMRIDAHCTVDLRTIRNPIVIFASSGDNITPPQQALGWIPAVYKSTDDLKSFGQRIVYLTNPKVGHLGLYVSSSVARFEHRAILENLPAITALPPGLFEMKIDNPTGDPDCERDKYHVRFEPRRVEDVRYEYPRAAFEQVRKVSEFNEQIYRTFMSPWVRAMINPWTAHAMEALHPMRTSRIMFSETFFPWMGIFGVLADTISKDRHALGDDNPLIVQERRLIAQIAELGDAARKVRDAAQERSFTAIYGA